MSSDEITREELERRLAETQSLLAAVRRDLQDLRKASREATAERTAASNQDITERKKAEEQARAEQVRLQMALEAAGMVTWEWDIPTGVIRYFHDLSSIVRGEEWAPFCAIETLLARIHPDDRGRLAEALDRAVKEIKPWQCEFRTLVLDGTYRWILGRGRTVVVRGGRPVRMLGVSIDITELKTIEERLGLSENRYRTLFDNMAEAFAVHEILTDEQGRPCDYRFLDINSSFERITGLKRSQVLNRTVREVLPGIESSWIEEYGKVALTGEPSNFEKYYPAPLERWYEVSAYSPAPRQFATVFLDISRRKSAEEALRKSEELSRQQLLEIQNIYDSAPVGLCVLDRDLRFTRINRRLAEINGIPAADHIGKTVDEIVPTLAPTARRIAEQIFQTGTGLTDVEFVDTTESRSGVQRTFLEHWLPLKDSAGSVVGINVVAEEITERKRTEQALRDSERRYSALFANRINGMAHCRIITDEQGRPVDHLILQVNDAYEQITGLKKESVEGRRATEVFPDIRNSSFDLLGVYGKIALEGGEMQFEQFFEPTRRYLLVYAYSPQRGEFAVIFSDISERKQMENELKQSRAELEQRVQERTKELSETVSTLHKEAAQRRLAEQSLVKRSEQLRRMTAELTLAEQRERQRLAQVLHDGLQQILVGAKFRIASMARTEAGRHAMDQVEDLIDDAIETSRSLTAELSPPILLQRDLLLALEWLAHWMHDKYELNVNVTATRKIQPLTEELTLLLFQAARELLFNVVKHAGVNTACVEVSQQDGQLVMTVADEGAGFVADQVAGKPGGVGLFGISERLSYMGGKMEIDSAPGKGSRFRLVVPCARLAQIKRPRVQGPMMRVSVATSHPPEAETAGGARKIRIVLVDDHLIMRQGLSGLLRMEPDFEIAGEASDGQSAVNLIREVKPDVVLMDISMPGMDGIQATRIIHEELPEIRIIGLSMFQEEERQAAMSKAGAVNYLTKTGPSESVIQAIRDCVAIPSEELPSRVRRKPRAQRKDPS